MTVIIKEMNKPKKCGQCPFYFPNLYNSGGHCKFHEKKCSLEEISPDCPLKEIDENEKVPRKLWETKSKREILMDMKRYEKENMPIPQEWIKELRDLTANLAEIK